MKYLDITVKHRFADSATPTRPVFRNTDGSACGLATMISSRVRGAFRNGV